MLFGENAVQQGSLAGAEEAGENGDGNTLVGGHEEEKRESGKAGKREGGKGWKNEETLKGANSERSKAGKTARPGPPLIARSGPHPAAFWSS